VIRPLAYVEESDLEAYAELRAFPIIPCDLCGSQDQLQRKQVKAMLHEWERRHPGRIARSSMRSRVSRRRISSTAISSISTSSSKNPNPLHLSDPNLEMTPKHFPPPRKITSFHPPQRTLMGPGPTEIHPRVLTTMSQPAIGYLDPVFVEMMEELKSLLRYAYQTENPLTFPISGRARWAWSTAS
jgi:hypothetical protein